MPGFRTRRARAATVPRAGVVAAEPAGTHGRLNTFMCPRHRAGHISLLRLVMCV
jgi:hypothetical protein